MEFVDQLGDGSALHLVLIERLHGGEAGGGAGLGAFVHGFCFYLKSSSRRRPGSRPRVMRHRRDSGLRRNDDTGDQGWFGFNLFRPLSAWAGSPPAPPSPPAAGPTAARPA